MAKQKGTEKMIRRNLIENGNNGHATWRVGTPR